MGLRFFTILVFFSIPTGLLMASPQQEFNRAAYLISEENYEEAFEVYRGIEESEYLSGALFLNMGITLIHADSLGLAKYYFMRAGEFNETRSRALEGLDYVNTEIERRHGSIPILFSSWWRDWIQFEIGIWNLLIGAIIVFNLAALIIAVGWFKPTISFWMKITGIPLMVISLLAMAMAIWLDWHSGDYVRGVIIQQEVTLMAEPTETAEEVENAYEGFTVTHNRPKSMNHQGWAHITLSNGVSGWVPSSGLRTL